MSNQPLEDSVESLRHRLRFLPEAEREAEINEFRSHLLDRLAAYENSGETSEHALNSALQKWGEQEALVQALRYRWLLRKIDQPVLIALFLTGAGQYLLPSFNTLFNYLYQIIDPADHSGIAELFHRFSYSHYPSVRIAHGLSLLIVNGLVAAGAALLIAYLRLKNVRKGVLLYTLIYSTKIAWWLYSLASLGLFSRMNFGEVSTNLLLTDTNRYFEHLLITILGIALMVFPQIYCLFITLFILRTRVTTNSALESKAA